MSVGMFDRRSASASRERVSVAPEVRIVLEVARELRISPRFSDDGAPEGTIDRPFAIDKELERDPMDEEVEDEQTLDVYELQP